MIYHKILENDRVSLRALEPSDVDIIYEWENDTDVWLVSSTQVPYSKDLIEKYIQSAYQDIYTIKQLRLVIDAKDIDVPVGTIDFYDFDPNNRRAGVGIIIAPQYRKKTYASEALERLIDYGFQVLNLHQIYASISIDNVASLKLFQKCGFKITGQRKEWLRTPQGWLDEYTLQLLSDTNTIPL